MVAALSVFANEKIDSLNRELSSARTSADSLPILYNIYDLSGNGERRELGKTIFDISKRVGNDAICNDMLRNMTYGNFLDDSTLTLLISEAEQLLPTIDRNETLTILKIRRAAALARNTNPNERRQLLQHYLKLYATSQANDIYTRIEQLFTVCIILGSDTKGELLTDYLQQLGELIKQLPPSSTLALQRMYFTQAAQAYTFNFEYVKAVAADKELINLLERHRNKYRNEGRVFYNCDQALYESYRRLLSNYRALTTDEIELFYNRTKQLAAANKSINDDLQKNERATIYYLMATHRYSEALPILKRQVANATTARYRRYFLGAMIEASRAIGDNKTLLESSLAYNEALDELLASKNAERYRELEIIYSVTNLRTQNTRLEVEKRETALRTGRAIIAAGIVLLIVLAVFVFLLFRSYRKSSQLATKLNASNSLLVAESNNLKSAQDELIVARDNATTTEKQKSEFIDNFIHEVTTPLNAISEYSQLVIDSLDDTKRKYMKKYCDIVTLNVDLLQTLVNDVLDITAADQSLLTVFRRPYSLATICTVACESIKKRVHPDVQLIFENADEPDWIVLTDATRVEQVLINLLSNAAKFTETGEIRLRYDVDVNRKRLTFSVTDTGIGVPRGREDEIFKRYVKLSKYSQGLGLGLPVCRLLADLLSGSVTIDKRYRQGARFVFTLNNCSMHRVNRDIEKH